MAEDLRHFLAEQTVIQSEVSPGGVAAGGAAARTVETHAPKSASTSADSVAASSGSMKLGSSDNEPIRIVPRGLRSFDAHDADFFLELLPGARDRDGLPDSLRFWKTWRGLRPQPKVAITLRRDEHLSIDIHQTRQGSTVSRVAWG